MCLFHKLVFVLYAVIVPVISMNEAISIDCDPIGNMREGRKYSFIRNVTANRYSKFSVKKNAYADMKHELVFDSCSLYTLPLAIFENYPNLEIVYTWNTGLVTVVKEIFRNARHLKLLDLSLNFIEELPEHTFSLAPILEQLDISRNSLRIIDGKAFYNLFNLRDLYLDNNQITLIPAETFHTLDRLHVLRLNNNFIKTLATEAFSRNHKLTHIHLNNNRIESLSAEQMFRHLNHVKEFDLHNNPIKNMVRCVINAETIDIRNTGAYGCHVGISTKYLKASDNKIAFVEISNASTNLVHVDLANNNLTEIRNLTNLKQLTHLDISKNNIKDYSVSSFAHMSQLETLRLQNSGLSQIGFGFSSYKLKLKTLDISYNQLEHIDINTFVSLIDLRTLYLEGNNLTDINIADIRKIFPSLTRIGIADNNWHCKNLAQLIKLLDINGIVINSIGLVKNNENIKGIPCRSAADDNISSKFEQFATSTTSVATTVTPTGHQLPAKTSNKCHISLTKANDMELVVRLIKLKYEAIDAKERVFAISEKIERILDLMQNKEQI